MTLQLPTFDALPPPPKEGKLLEIAIADLKPTQMCVGLAEVQHRRKDFATDSLKERRKYLKGKPVPLVHSPAAGYWMLDRHHRLRGLLEIDPSATAFGYVVLELQEVEADLVLQILQQKGWLYLNNGRGQGPQPPRFQTFWVAPYNITSVNTPDSSVPRINTSWGGCSSNC